jgi:osmotically-inducible protein OsmY
MNKRARLLLFTATSVFATVGLGGCNKQPVATVTAPAVPPAGVNVADMDVTEHVRTALRQSDALKGFDISVVTIKGDVRLNGVLDSQAQVDEALRIARAAEGAHSIHDELTIKK